MADNYALIRQAIVERRQVRATYEGMVREMCPHVLGTKGGRRQVLFFQFAGGSRKGLPPGGEWRCLPVDDLADVSIGEGGWRTGARYSQARQTCIDRIDVAVPVDG